MKKFGLLIIAIFLGLSVIACNDKKDTEPVEHPDSTKTIAEEILPDADVEKTELKNDELPEAVRETIEYQYSGAEIQNVVEKSNGIEKQYKITLKHHGAEVVLNITESGKLLVK